MTTVGQQIPNKQTNRPSNTSTSGLMYVPRSNNSHNKWDK